MIVPSLLQQKMLKNHFIMQQLLLRKTQNKHRTPLNRVKIESHSCLNRYSSSQSVHLANLKTLLSKPPIHFIVHLVFQIYHKSKKTNIVAKEIHSSFY